MVNIKDLSQLLSDFFEEDLDPVIAREINELICKDCHCRTLFNTFVKTIYLCREIKEIDIPISTRLKLFQSLGIEGDLD
jgi:hypothetical protein